MGVDIYAESGVVVTAKQLSAIIIEENRERAARLLLRHTALLLQALKNHKIHGTSGDQDLAEHLRKTRQRAVRMLTFVFQSLEITSSVEALRSMLQSMTQVEDNSSTCPEFAYVLDVWALLLRELHPEAPVPRATVFIDSPRHQGCDLPQGEVLFVFEESDCFETVKSKAGIALDKVLGDKTRVATWARYSY